MKTLQLAMAGLAALGAALVAAPEPANAGYYGYGYSYGRPHYGYSYGYYRRPVVKKVVVVQRPYYPVYRRPYVRRVVVQRPFYGRPYGYGYRYGYRW